MELSYPEGASLTKLEHPKHAILKLHRAVKLCQVVVVDAQQLKNKDTEEVRDREGKPFISIYIYYI